MNLTKLKYMAPVLIIATLLMVVFKLYQLNKTDFDIDVLTKQLAPLPKYIKPNSTIGFYINNNDPQLFMEIQYVMAPQIISNTVVPDTILLIQSKSGVVKPFEHYRTIIQNQDNGRIVSLITKGK